MEPRRSTPQTGVLLSPAFLVPLSFLLLNDRYLKAAFGNGLTGKLSDFCGLFVFAFAATSYRTDIPVDLRFAFEGSRPELLARLEELGIRAFGPWPGSAPDSYELAIPADVRFDQFTAMVTLTEQSNRTLIHVREMEHRCPREGDEAEILPRLFEKKVVVPLHLERL